MINLEEEARKRRERLKSSLSNTTEPIKQPDSIQNDPILDEQKNTKEFNESFEVPDDEILLDESGAEILGLDSKIPDTIEAQVKSLLSTQNDLIYSQQKNNFNFIDAKDRNSDLKREYERRMTGLNRKTKRAVVDIVRARLEKEEQETSKYE